MWLQSAFSHIPKPLTSVVVVSKILFRIVRVHVNFNVHYIYIKPEFMGKILFCVFAENVYGTDCCCCRVLFIIGNFYFFLKKLYYLNLKLCKLLGY